LLILTQLLRLHLEVVGLGLTPVGERLELGVLRGQLALAASSRFNRSAKACI